MGVGRVCGVAVESLSGRCYHGFPGVEMVDG
jgi:hypothetical protein